MVNSRAPSNTLTFEKVADSDTILDQSGQHRHRQLLGRLLWLDRPDIKNAVLSIVHSRRHSYNSCPACNIVVGCSLDVPGIAGTPQGSVLVMTDADWAGDVKDRRSYSGIAVWVKGSPEKHLVIRCMRLPRSRTWFA